uniref:Protease n=1 Tax=Hemiscolopendra marginata TaxID=943146 RepID=A0A646QDK7_9MYRI
MKTYILTLFVLSASIRSVKSDFPSDCQPNRIKGEPCYVFSSFAANFSDAEAHCRNNGGLLVIVKTEEVQEEIVKLISSSNDYLIHSWVWIGISNRNSEEDYIYSDGSKMAGVDYRNWASGQPRDLYMSSDESNQACIFISPYTFEWYNDRCTKENRFICQFLECNIYDITVKNGKYDECHSNYLMPVGSTILMQCQEGYILKGKADIKCEDVDKWSHMPECLKGCSLPPSFPNANLAAMKDHYVIGNTALYACEEGYVSKTNPERSHFIITCSSNSKWTPPESGCANVKIYSIKGVEVMTNDFVKLSCDVQKQSNKSSGLYTWLKDSIDLSNTQLEYNLDSTGDLILYENSTENISGLYTCFAIGKILIPGATVYDVKRTGDNRCDDIFSSNKETHYIYKEGAAALLQCPHPSSYSGFHWFKDGEFYPLNDEHVLYPDGSLYIRHVKFSDQGTYTCMMTLKDTFCTKNITAEVKVITTTGSICGKPSTSTLHPWTVSLWWKDEIAPFCYGALIYENWVLTTAQCLSGLYRKRKLNIFVRFGSDPMKDISSGGNLVNDIIDIPVITVKIHPLYSKKMSVNDVGFVKLKEPVQFSSTIRPICVPEIDITAKIPCVEKPPLTGLASGWGKLERNNIEGITLKEENMTLIPHGVCFPTETHYMDKVLCFKKTNGTLETFAGDHGSPLEVLWNDRVYLLGVLSWGSRISQLGEYDYYTKVSSYFPWISSFLEEE